MTRVAITGHRDLTGATTELVGIALHASLLPYAGRLVGVSCLAEGADQIFARIVLDLGGTLEAVILRSAEGPSVPDDEAPRRADLLRRCATVETVACRTPTGEAHLRAGMAMLARADVLLAVWDGLPGRGPGGTADIVAHAERLGMAVDVVWPVRARRRWPIRQQSVTWTPSGPSVTLAGPATGRP